MKKIELSPGIFEYRFEPFEGQFFANKIIAIIDETKVLLIDAAYENQMNEVLDDLKSNDLIVEKVIISHFHDDHMQGLKKLSNVTIYGSDDYKKTLDLWTPIEEHKIFTPNVLVKDSLKINFGNHIIEMIKSPGHSECTILVKINDEFLYIGDELMFSNEGEPILPCISKNETKRQLNNASKLYGYKNMKIIPAHGILFEGEEKIEKEIKNVIIYLEALMNSNHNISYEESVKNCTCNFLHKNWHDKINTK
jgi:glyoxylase-like metal-dependent hydrolase (beta-lactamase superfamily II)